MIRSITLPKSWQAPPELYDWWLQGVAHVQYGIYRKQVKPGTTIGDFVREYGPGWAIPWRGQAYNGQTAVGYSYVIRPDDVIDIVRPQ